MLRRLDWVIALGALFGIGCSGPAETSAGAGLNLSISATTASCGAGAAQLDDVGNPPPDHTKGTPGKVVFDGENGMKASCSVKGTGPWTITGSMNSNSPRVGFIVNSATINADGTGTGDITLSTAALDSVLNTPPGKPCKIEAVKNGDTPQVRPGAVWATFSCPDLFAPPSSTCFASGEFVFDHCSH